MKRIRIIDEFPPYFGDYHPSLLEIQDIVGRKPPGCIFPNLRSISWPILYARNFPLSFFFSPAIRKLNLCIEDQNQIAQIQDVLRSHKPDLQSLMVTTRDPYLGRRAISLSKTIPGIKGLNNLSTLVIGYHTIYWEHPLFISRKLMVSLPQLVHLRTFRIALGSEANVSHLLDLPSDAFIGFPALQNLGISWTTDSVQGLVLKLLQGITSPTFRLTEFHVPTSVTRAKMLELTTSLSVYPSITQIMLTRKTHPNDSDGTDWNAAAIVSPLFKLSKLRAISFGGFTFDWDDDLCRDMARSWPNIWKIWMEGVEEGKSLDVNSLVHLAENCPELSHLAIPFYCKHTNGDSIDAVYNRADRKQPLNIYSIATSRSNDLALALSLYTLFGVFTFIAYPLHDRTEEALRFLLKYRQQDGRIDKSALVFEDWDRNTS